MSWWCLEISFCLWNLVQNRTHNLFRFCCFLLLKNFFSRNLQCCYDLEMLLTYCFAVKSAWTVKDKPILIHNCWSKFLFWKLFNIVDQKLQRDFCKVIVKVKIHLLCCCCCCCLYCIYFYRNFQVTKIGEIVAFSGELQFGSCEKTAAWKCPRNYPKSQWRFYRAIITRIEGEQKEIEKCLQRTAGTW